MQALKLKIAHKRAREEGDPNSTTSPLKFRQSQASSYRKKGQKKENSNTSLPIKKKHQKMTK